MFLRRLGRKVLLLHCYRDGEGNVKQRRLAHFDTAEELQALLVGDRWCEWQARIQAAFPDVRVNWDSLRARAHALAAGAGPANGSGGSRTAARRQSGRQSAAEAAQRVGGGAARGEVGRLLRRLARCIEEQTDAEGREWMAVELEDLRERCLLRATPCLRDAERLVQDDRLEGARDLLERLLRQNRRELDRRCFDPGDGAGRVRLKGLELLGNVLERLDDVQGAAAAWEERVGCNPDADALAAYGACLQRLGRLEEAARQYGRIAKKDPSRHFHLASAHWESGQPAQALEAILRGLVLDRSVGEELKTLQKRGAARGYWERHARLWSPTARVFFEKIYQDPSVRWTLTRAAERNRRPRQLLPQYARELLLQKAGVNEQRLAGERRAWARSGGRRL